MTAIWDEFEAKDVVVEGRGWRQTTPVEGGRFYEDTAPSCPLAEATDQRFDSLTHTLRTCFPTDFTGATKSNIAKYVWDHIGEIATNRAMYDDIVATLEKLWREDPDFAKREEESAEKLRRQSLKDIRESASISLDAAANRGSAIHRAIEARILGTFIDHEDLHRNGAAPYLAAVEAFLLATDPQPILVEAVAFGRETGTACTLDFAGQLTIPGVGGVVVTDWKTRTKDHERRPKEAAQLGGIIDMACGGYYFNDRGHRRQLEVDGAGIVTFTPDGTWRWHPVEPAVAVESWRAALNIRPHTLVSHVYGKAVSGQPLDVVSATKARLATIPDGSPEKMRLAKQWTQHRLPQVPDLTVDDWPTVDLLLSQSEPFPGNNPETATFCTLEDAATLAARLRALPPDLRAAVLRSGGALTSVDSPVMTTDDLEDWERILTPTEAKAARRLEEIDFHLGPLAEDVVAAVTACFTVPRKDWVDSDLERLAELIDAHEAGDLIIRDGRLIVSPRVVESLPKLETRTKAREVATKIGRPVPSKYDAVMCDVVLYAATRAA